MCARNDAINQRRAATETLIAALEHSPGIILGRPRSFGRPPPSGTVTALRKAFPLDIDPDQGGLVSLAQTVAARGR